MPDTLLTPGTIVANRYELKEFIGSGSFGEVWLAQDLTLEIEVAIKLYITLDSSGQSEFKDEYRVAYGLNHENLLTSTYYDIWERRPFLIMKFCVNGSASTLAGTADETTVWQFIHDVAAGLRYLHSQATPVIHQDIKPANILIDENSRFLITDFGISRKLRSTLRKQSKRSVGSGAISYMGPERFLSDPIAVKASDIWSLGVSAYELCTGELPFMGQGGGMLNAGAQLPNVPSDRFSPTLNAVIRACLEKETWNRPSAETLETFSAKMLAGENPKWPSQKGKGQPKAPKTPKTPKLHKQGKSNTRLWLSLLIFIGCAALGAGAYLYFSGNKTATATEQKAATAQATKDEAKNEAILNQIEAQIAAADNANFTPLLAARISLDSLQSAGVSKDLEPRFNEVAQALDKKSEEAAASWYDFGMVQRNDGQEDLATEYLQYAAALNPSPDAPAMTALKKAGIIGLAYITGNILNVYMLTKPNYVQKDTYRYILRYRIISTESGKTETQGEFDITLPKTQKFTPVEILLDKKVPKGQYEILFTTQSGETYARVEATAK